MQLTFPDGNIIHIEKNALPEDVIRQHLNQDFLNTAIAVKIDQEVIDLQTPITSQGNFLIIKKNDEDSKKILWHSSAHVLAYAIKTIYPNVKFAIGPAIENGFYYDMELDKTISEDDFENIKKEVEKIIQEKIPFKRMIINFEEAKELFKNNEYKLEMIEELKKKNTQITCYKLGDFIDLCKGPHLKHTGEIKAFKILKTSGAYWKGDSQNKQLTRIYGISFFSRNELKEYLIKQEEIAKREHKKIGRELNLFSFHEQAPGMVFFHDKGSFIFNKLVDFIISIMYKKNYEINKTPIILNKELWLQSGHWEHYKENMYFTMIDKQEFAVKPMNCPGNILIFKANQYSYRDLPIRAGEFGLVHRHELSGVLSGLLRVRSFTQDDAHIFCTKEQLKHEIKDLLDFMDIVYKTFNFKYEIKLSTKPEKAMGDSEIWELAENTLKEVLEEMNKDYILNVGDGAFYGPKIDFDLTDALGRKWQCGTIQLDFQMPEKFNLTYEADDNTKKRPIMLHRAVLGSVERFMAILIEHYAGKFPLWISPLQVVILPIADRHNEYAFKLKDVFKKNGFRVKVNNKTETINKKIRSSQLEKINYIIVVGDKEVNEQTINVRTREGVVLGEKTLISFIEELKKEVEEKR